MEVTMNTVKGPKHVVVNGERYQYVTGELATSKPIEIFESASSAATAYPELADDINELETKRIDQEKDRLGQDVKKMDAFADFLQSVHDLQNKGVTLTDMSFSGILTKLEASSFSDTERSKWGLKLRTLWDEVIYQYDGSMRQARYDLPLAMDLLGWS